MATPFNLHANLAERKARQRADKLRAQFRFAEARNVEPVGRGCAVLRDAAKADVSGDDERYGAKPDPRY